MSLPGLLAGGGCLLELTQSLAVRHLMTPAALLSCAMADEPVAMAVGRMQDDFDQLPVRDPQTGAIVGLLTRQAVEGVHDETPVQQALTPVSQTARLSSQATLPEALEALQDQPAVLVYDAPRMQVVGLLHYADFNRHPARVFFYLWLSALEMSLVKLLDDYFKQERLDVHDWLIHLPEARQVTILGRYELSRRERIDLTPLEGAELSDLLRLCGSLEPLRQKLGYASKSALDKVTSHLVSLRHAAMHPVRSLIGSHADLSRQLDRYRDLQKFLIQVEQAGRENGQVEPA